MKEMDLQTVIFLGCVFLGIFSLNKLEEGLKEMNQVYPPQQTKQPHTQGNLNTTYKSDSVTTKQYIFKSYSPITEHQKNHVKEKR